MDIYRETSPAGGLMNWHVVAGKTALPLTTIKFADNQYQGGLTRGVTLRAAGAGEDMPNTDIVWVGRAGVTADSNANTGGLPLLPGASIALPVDDPSQVYVISTSDNQDIAVIAV